MLPVRSAKLTPGTVARRVIEAPGLRPFVVIGDDEASRAWLQRRVAALRERGAVGLVVNVETAQGLARLATTGAVGIALDTGLLQFHLEYLLADLHVTVVHEVPTMFLCQFLAELDLLQRFLIPPQIF